MYTIHEDAVSIPQFLESLPIVKIVTKQGKDKRKYLNVSASFDIETSSFYLDTKTGKTLPFKKSIQRKERGKRYQRQAIMYAWVFTLNGLATIGRTWKEFTYLMERICAKYHLSEDLILPIYVHNLAYEFAFCNGYFEWTDIFALSEREPLYCRTSSGLEFRDSLSLSGYNLEMTGENLHKYKVSKLVGELDYSLLRNSKTPMKSNELQYLINDGLVVSAYIQEQIEENGNITRIPMTNTGFVRRDCRNACLYGDKNHRKDNSLKYRRYRRRMEAETLEVKEFKLAHRAFHGGLVHCSAINEGEIYENITSMDFTSSYPYCLIAFKYPWGKGEQYHPRNKKDFNEILKCRLAIFDVEFIGLESKVMFEHIWSGSKCYDFDDMDLDNGRVVSAKRIRTSMTSIDFKAFSHFYSWKKMRIGLMYVYHYNYLPTDFVKFIVKLYKDKTTLKCVSGEEAETRYRHAKSMLNALYGMCVMSPIREKILFSNGEWNKEMPDIEEEIDKYNNDKRRFTNYLTGVFCTSYAMYNLCTGIKECGKNFDYIYCDTDSLKIRNVERHKAYFDKYNANVEKLLRQACAHHGIPFEDVAPKTIKGETKMLGVWDFEYKAKRFKAMRAKCYAYEMDDGYHITIAGVKKKNAKKIKQLADENKKDFFDLIEWGIEYDEDVCGKLLHTYIDEPIEGILTDYLGHSAHYKEMSCVHLEPTTYKLTAGDMYLDFLESMKEYAFIE